MTACSVGGGALKPDTRTRTHTPPHTHPHTPHRGPAPPSPQPRGLTSKRLLVTPFISLRMAGPGGEDEEGRGVWGRRGVGCEEGGGGREEGVRKAGAAPGCAASARRVRSGLNFNPKQKHSAPASNARSHWPAPGTARGGGGKGEGGGKRGDAGGRALRRGHPENGKRGGGARGGGDNARPRRPHLPHRPPSPWRRRGPPGVGGLRGAPPPSRDTPPPKPAGDPRGSSPRYPPPPHSRCRRGDRGSRGGGAVPRPSAPFRDAAELSQSRPALT